jgi:uncharacterized protein YndB with AHSA1/START domain
MSHRSARLTAVTMFALTLALAAAPRVRAADVDIAPTFEDQKSTLDAKKALHLDLTASMNAPVDKVYDALTNPEKVATYDAQITSAKLVSKSANGKVVEFFGQTIAVPNAPKSLKVKFTFDPDKKTIVSQSTGKALIQFRNEVALSPSKDGKGTEIHYTSVSADPSKALGMDTPEFMRIGAARGTFMSTLNNAGKYIQSGGKEAPPLPPLSDAAH